MWRGDEITDGAGSKGSGATDVEAAACGDSLVGRARKV